MARDTSVRFSKEFGFSLKEKTIKKELRKRVVEILTNRGGLERIFVRLIFQKFGVIAFFGRPGVYDTDDKVFCEFQR